MARRDPHGRGLRGPLIASNVPASRSRRGVFEAVVGDAMITLQERWGNELGAVVVDVEDLPPAIGPLDAEVPAGASAPSVGGEPAHIVIYRRPLEDRAGSDHDLVAAVRDAVTKQVACLLGRPPEDVDPDYGR